MGLYSSAEDKFFDFADWCDAHGIPLGSAARALEKRGVPPLAAFIAILLVAGYAAVSLFPQAPVSTSSLSIVVTAADFPLGGATVIVRIPEKDYYNTTVSDADGVARFDGLPAGSALVSASMEGYMASEQGAVLTEGARQSVALSLTPGSIEKRRISISLQDKDTGAPVDGTVKLLYANGTTAQWKSSESGSVEFSVDPNAVYNVMAQAQGYSDGSAVKAVGDSDELVTIPLLSRRAGEGKATVSITVADEAGAQLAGMLVEIRENETGTTKASDYTGAGGRVSFELGMGTTFYAVARDSKNSYASGKSDVYVLTEAALIKLTMHRAEAEEALTIIAKDREGAALSGAVVRIYEASTLARLDERRTVDGRARFRTVSRASFFATVYLPGYLPVGVASLSASEERVVEMERSVAGNNAQVRVFAHERDGNATAGATVSLHRDDGTPLGLPEKATGADGYTAAFLDVPLASIFAKAAHAQREGRSSIAPAANATLEVEMPVPMGTARARVTDRLTKKPVAGAKVVFKNRIGGETLGSCTSPCSAAVAAGEVYAEISASGYATYTTASQAIAQGATVEFAAELSASPAAFRADFAGLFDLDGKRVKSVSPGGEYKALFRFSLPGIGEKTALHVRTGDSAVLSAYGAIDATAIKTGATYTPPSGQAADENSTGPLKWVNFEFGRNTGVVEASVQVRVKPSAAENLELRYRASYTRGGEIFRAPEDAEAPKRAGDANATKQDLYANTNSQTFSISPSALTCDGGVCYALSFVSGSSEFPVDSFSASLNGEFKLRYKVLYEQPTAATIMLSTASPSLALLRYATTKPIASAGGVSANVTIPQAQGDAFEGEITIKAQRIDKAAALTFGIKDAKGAITKDIALAITGGGTLRIGAPTHINALGKSDVTVTVKDGSGNAVEDARVMLKSAGKSTVLAEALELTGSDATGTGGEYLFEDVEPIGAGRITASATREGYNGASASITVTAPSIIAVSPDKVSFDVTDSEVTQQVTVKNLLSNALSNVRASVSGSPRLTELSASPSSFDLKPNEERQVAVTAARADVAETTDGKKDKAQSESIAGTLSITARLGATAQTESIDIAGSNKMTLRGIDGAYGASPSSLSFSLSDAELDETQSGELSITNSLASGALLVNAEVSGAGVDIDPLSLVVQPSESSAFKVTASAPEDAFDTHGCVKKEKKYNGKITLTVSDSKSGARSKKAIPVSLSVTPSGKCAKSWGFVDKEKPKTWKAKESFTGEWSAGDLADGKLEFSFDDLKHGDVKTIKIYNRGNVQLSIGQSAITGVNLYVNNASRTSRKFGYRGEWSNVLLARSVYPSKEGAEFDVVASIDNLKDIRSAHDEIFDAYGCIKGDLPKSGKITFTATGEGFESEQAVGVTLNIKASGTCPHRIFERAAASFKELRVNYAKENSMLFNFKAPGHYRYLAVINNFDEEAKIAIAGPGYGSIVKCDFSDRTFSKGEAAVVKCNSLAPGKAAVRITATGKEKTDTKTVESEVFNAASNPLGPIYAATPLGKLAVSSAPAGEGEGTGRIIDDIAEIKGRLLVEPAPVRILFADAPKETTASASGFGETCSNHYCNSDQATSAFADGILQMLDIADKFVNVETDKQKNLAAIKEFCNVEKNPVIEKSMVIQLANVKVGDKYLGLLTTLRDKSGMIVRYGDAQLPSSLGGSMDGCGVYTIKMQLYPCLPASYAGSLPDWWKGMQMGFTIKRQASCEENLANAALFMVGEKEGKEDIPIRTYAGAKESKWNAAGLGTLFETNKESPDITLPNELDVKGIQQLSGALSVTTPEAAQSSSDLVEDTDFCTDAQTLLRVGAMTTSLAATAKCAPGGAWGLAICAALNVLPTLTSCYAPIAGGEACKTACECVTTAAASAIIPGAGITAKVIPASTKLITAFTVTLSAAGFAGYALGGTPSAGVALAGTSAALKYSLSQLYAGKMDVIKTLETEYKMPKELATQFANDLSQDKEILKSRGNLVKAFVTPSKANRETLIQEGISKSEATLKLRVQDVYRESVKKLLIGKLKIADDEFAKAFMAAMESKPITALEIKSAYVEAFESTVRKSMAEGATEAAAVEKALANSKPSVSNLFGTTEAIYDAAGNVKVSTIKEATDALRSASTTKEFEDGVDLLKNAQKISEMSAAERGGAVSTSLAEKMFAGAKSIRLATAVKAVALGGAIIGSTYLPCDLRPAAAQIVSRDNYVAVYHNLEGWFVTVPTIRNVMYGSVAYALPKLQGCDLDKDAACVTMLPLVKGESRDKPTGVGRYLLLVGTSEKFMATAAFDALMKSLFDPDAELASRDVIKKASGKDVSGTLADVWFDGATHKSYVAKGA